MVSSLGAVVLLDLTNGYREASATTVSVLLYGSETWTMRKTDSDKVQAFHMSSQRRILGIRWYDHVTNSTVKETTGLADLTLMIADRRHSVFGHICRLSTESPVRRAYTVVHRRIERPSSS